LFGNSKRYRKLINILKICIAVGIIYILIQLSDLNQVRNILAQTNLIYLPIIAFLVLIDRFLMSYKWAMLLKSRGVNLKSKDALHITLVSNFVGSFLPVTAGTDLVKIARTRIAGVNAFKVTASIFMERLLGLISVTIVAIGGISYLLITGKYEFIEFYYFSWIIFFISISCFIITTKKKISKRMNKRFKKYAKYKIINLLLNAYSEYSEIGSKSVIISLFLLMSVVEHLILCLMHVAGAMAIGMSVPYYIFFAIVPISSLLGLLPISIGGLGVTEGLLVFLLSLANVHATESFTLSIFMRATSLFVIVPGGILFLIDSYKIRKVDVEKHRNPLLSDRK